MDPEPVVLRIGDPVHERFTTETNSSRFESYHENNNSWPSIKLDTNTMYSSKHQKTPFHFDHNSNWMPSTEFFNPFEIDEVIKLVCHHLNFKSLKESRKISSQWNRLASRILVYCQGHFVRVPSSSCWSSSSSSTIKKFKNYLTSLSIPIENVAIWHLDDIQILGHPDIAILSQWTKNIKYFPHPLDTDDQPDVPRPEYQKIVGELCQLLKNLPNLDTLSTDHLPKKPAEGEDEARIRRYGGTVWKWDWDLFLERLKKLKKIKIVHFLGPSVLLPYAPIHSKLVIRRHLSLDNSMSQFFKLVNTARIQLSNDIGLIRLIINPDDSPKLVRKFIHSTAASLVTLFITFSKQWRRQRYHDDDDDGGKFTNSSWYLPAQALGQLSKLTILTPTHPFDRCPENYGWESMEKIAILRTIMAALDLVKLHTLNVHCQHLAPLNLPQLGVNKEDEEEEKFRPIKSLGIYNAQIFKDASFFREGGSNLWSNLSQLILYWLPADEVGAAILKWIFSIMNTRLNILRLKLMTNAPNYYEQLNQTHGPTKIIPSPFRWDRILIGHNHHHGDVQGCPTPPNYLSAAAAEFPADPEITHAPSQKCFLKDMTELRQLSIVFGCGHIVGSIGDSLVYGAFDHLKKLEYLEVTNEEFSDTAVQVLRARVGPHLVTKLNEPPSWDDICYNGV